MTRPTHSTSRDTAIAAHAADVGQATGAPKDYIQLFPMGTVQGRDGRGPYRLDDAAHAARVVAASMASAGAAAIPIDYDHQIPFAVREGVGGAAPASGWIERLDAKPDGIWAQVKWTDAAAARIMAGEYRYISPYFAFDKTSGRLTRILNAGLVNYPNFTELAAVASADAETASMDLKTIAVALGLPEDAGADAVAAAAAAAKAAATPDPRAYVPMAAFTELQAQVRALQDRGLEDAATAAVDAATRAGKITPAGRDHALKLYRADPEAFAAFVGSAPVLLSPEAVDTAAARVGLDAGVMTADEKRAAALVGISEEKYLASKKQMMGAR